MLLNFGGESGEVMLKRYFGPGVSFALLGEPDVVPERPMLSVPGMSLLPLFIAPVFPGGVPPLGPALSFAPFGESDVVPRDDFMPLSLDFFFVELMPDLSPIAPGVSLALLGELEELMPPLSCVELIPESALRPFIDPVSDPGGVPPVGPAVSLALFGEAFMGTPLSLGMSAAVTDKLKARPIAATSGVVVGVWFFIA